jgi:hypothetical protein
MSHKFRPLVSRERIQAFVINCSSYPFVRGAFGTIYAAALVRIVVLMRLVPQIRSLYLKIPSWGTYCFGSSDLDLLATTRNLEWPTASALRDRLADFLLPRGSWWRIIDLHIFTERELDLKILVESSADATSRIRIFGTQRDFRRISSLDSNMNALFYEYFQICERVFSGPHTAHQIRIVSKTVLKVCEQLLLSGAEKISGDRATNDLFRRAVQFARGRGIQHVSETEVAEMFQLASAGLSELCDGLPADNNDKAEPKIRLTKVAEPPATMERFANRCRPELESLTAEFSDVIACAMIGGTPGCEFDYRIYLVLRDETLTDRTMPFFGALRKLFTSSSLLNSQFWRIRCPIVLTLSMWKSSSVWYHALHPCDESYFVRRHGVVLAGQDLRELSREPNENDLLRSAAQSVCDLTNIVWESIRHSQTTRLTDVLLGRIPVLWLTLFKATIVTTREEAMRECRDLDFPYFAILDELNRDVRDLPPERLPPVNSSIWKPWVEKSHELIDSMVETARCRIK